MNYLQPILLAANLILTTNSKPDGLALTPPMAWMTWQRFRCIIDCEEFPDDCISEKLIKEQATRLAKDGWLEAGYDTLVIDDCWSELERDSKTKRLVADKKRFPSGMKALGEFVHGLGLKFGIYGDYGTYTCERYPGSMGYEEIDAKTFTEWEVDYIKMDGCHSTSEEQRIGYEKFGKYLDQFGRKITYSCSYPAYLGGTADRVEYGWLSNQCHQYRNYFDVDDSFLSVLKIIEWYGDNSEGLRPHHGPGKWMDPDMLIAGNFGMTPWQNKIQMSVWAVLATPLIMSNDLRKIDQDSRDILTNKLAISVNQDKLGIMGYRIGSRSGFEMWARPLEGDKIALVIFSIRADGVPRPFEFSLEYVRKVIEEYFKMSKWYVVEDAWNDRPNTSPIPNVLNVTDRYTVYLRPMSCAFWLLSPVHHEADLSSLSYAERAKIRDSL